MLLQYIDFRLCVCELLAPDEQQMQREAFSKFPLSLKRHSLQRSSVGIHPLSRNVINHRRWTHHRRGNHTNQTNFVTGYLSHLPSFLLNTHSYFLKVIDSSIKKYFHINMAFHTEF